MPKPPAAGILPKDCAPPLNLMETIQVLDHRLKNAKPEDFEPIPTGFDQLDEALGGGQHSEDLYEIGGPTNIGKTCWLLQDARSAARRSLSVFVEFEHSPVTLMERLLCQEAFLLKTSTEISPNTILQAYRRISTRRIQSKDKSELRMLDELMKEVPECNRIWLSLAEDMERIWLVRGDSLTTDLTALKGYLEMAGKLNYNRVALFVDYAQRVPVFVRGLGWLRGLDQYDAAMRGFKSIALDYFCPVVVVVIPDAQGVRQGRIHLENQLGESTQQFEPDAAMFLNYDVGGTPNVFDVVRLSLEKNRRGGRNMEWRHHFHGPAQSFDRQGILVPEAESWQSDRAGMPKMEAPAAGGGAG